MRIGAREMKNRFGRYLQRVKRGESFIITVREKPVARLVPVQGQLPAEVLDLVRAGMVSWHGGKPEGLARPPEARGARTIAGLVAEDRR